jgi:hypothetical protein
LRKAPWNFSKDYKQAPSFHQPPWNYLRLCNVVQGGAGRCGLPDSGEAGGGDGWGSGGKGSRGCIGSIRVLSRRGIGASGQPRRRPAAAAAGGIAPASLQLGLGNKWPGQLQLCEREGVGACICSGGKQSETLGGGLQWRTVAEQPRGGKASACQRDSSAPL